MRKAVIVLGIVLAIVLAAVLTAAALAPQQNYCRMAIVLMQNEEVGLMTLGLGQPLAPSVSISRPIEPFWPAVMLCMREPTPEEAAIRDSVLQERKP